MNEIDAKLKLDLAVERVRRFLPRFTYSSQNHSGVDNIYPAVDNNQWTSGFWPGQIWLAYLHSGDPVFKYAGLIQSESMLARIKAKIEVDHHDMGFLYTPSCTAAWHITGDVRSREAALLAADQMLTRFQEKGGFFQAWGKMGAADNYRFIIDCLMNLPLLYFATEQTGNAEYAEKIGADAYARTAFGAAE
ncbi:MAG: glycoside hydrolase family 88 protein, partial [Clostridiales bacterium]|nr:glycoside hydrolase family 88 protein [Clostridiales bacterium]